MLNPILYSVMPLRKILSIATDMPTFSKLLVVILAVFAPLQSVVHVIVFLVFLDMVTSIYYQMQQCKHDKSFFTHLATCLRVIESHKLRRTVSKLFFYVMSLMAFYLFDFYLLRIKPLEHDMLVSLSVTNLAAILIAVTELTSISSNISRITNNPIFNTIMRIFNKKINDKLNINDDGSN